jgi:presenilin-like A22 family membrane protease
MFYFNIFDMAQTHQHKSSSDKDFTLLDNAVINLIVEKTKLNKEKYSLILSKTIIVYVLFIALAMYSSVTDFVSRQVVIVGLVVGTLLLAVVYFYVIDHFGKMDRDIDEVVSLLQTKAFLGKKK